jgi:hypothetical protein
MCFKIKKFSKANREVRDIKFENVRFATGVEVGNLWYASNNILLRIQQGAHFLYISYLTDSLHTSSWNSVVNFEAHFQQLRETEWTYEHTVLGVRSSAVGT